jgi:hypothetical protein
MQSLTEFTEEDEIYECLHFLLALFCKISTPDSPCEIGLTTLKGEGCVARSYVPFLGVDGENGEGE